MAEGDPPAAEKGPGLRYARAEEAILRAATDLFLTNGYDISMDEVAARAGCAKATLYNHHASKQNLLEAVVERIGEHFMRNLLFDEQDDLGTVLRRFAEEYERQSLSGRGRQFFRLFVADVSRFPELAATVYAATGARAVKALADELRRLHDNGAIRPIDPVRMAERFFGALTGAAHHKASAGGSESEAERQAFIAETVQMFDDWLTIR